SGDRRPAGTSGLSVRCDGGARVSQPSPSGGRVRLADHDARTDDAGHGKSQEDAGGRGLRPERSRVRDALRDGRERTGRHESRLGAVPRRPSADDDDRRSFTPGHARALQARDQRHRGGRRRASHAADATPQTAARGKLRQTSETVMATLGFVGLGAMGSRLPRRLLGAGHTVVGYNRTPDKARDLVTAGLRLEKTPAAVAAATGAVFSMVTDDTALRSVALGRDGIVGALAPGTTYVEMSTVSPALTREIGDAVARRGAAMLDAPVSGSTITVEQGQASIAVGGDAAALERVRPYLLTMGPGGITHVGPLGLAKAMKVATNLGLAVQMLAFSEAVLLAEKSGIPRETAVEALLKSVVASPMVKYRGPFVVGKMPT